MRVRISELKAHLSEHLRRVEAGGHVEVLDRARPVARIVPVHAAHDGLEILPSERPFATVRSVRAPRVKTTMTSLEALRLDRGSR